MAQKKRSRTTQRKRSSKTTQRKRSSASQKKRTVIHVAPNRKDGGWDVKQHGKNKPASSHRVKAVAVQRGRRLAKRSAPGEIKIFSSKGKIQASHKYDR